MNQTLQAFRTRRSKAIAAVLAPLLLTSDPSRAAENEVAPGTPSPPEAGTGPDPFAEAPGGADEEEPALASISVFLEQDVLLLSGNQDRNYTMGLGFQSSGRWVRELYLDRPLLWLDAALGVAALRKWLGTSAPTPLDPTAFERRRVETHAFLFGNGAFTPDDLTQTELVRDDRPYASLLFAQVAHTTAYQTDGASDLDTDRAFKSTLTIGVLGLHVSEVVQTGIHRLLRSWSDKETPYDPEGWDNQISDGGEPTLGYSLAVLQRASQSSFHDLTLRGELNLGYYTNLAAGLSLRLGHIRSPFWAFDSNALSSANEGARPPRPDSSGWELYAFGATRGRAVGYNALLQGQFRDNVHELAPSQVERFLYEFETGAHLRIGSFGLTYVGLAGRSSELDIGRPRTHYWASLYLTYTN